MSSARPPPVYLFPTVLPPLFLLVAGSSRASSTRPPAVQSLLQLVELFGCSRSPPLSLVVAAGYWLLLDPFEDAVPGCCAHNSSTVPTPFMWL
ncbi:hypothetical protein CDL15_Pgr006559 [Punica granatum]|uniref:Secreted protein n=1 Tax=Punica granatum TaxID=22663 RepID=A0A218XZK4_PUNGR|nr:hypothetical protein CDL15_Pgr006559 [Punica granatum]PKI52749.1 hypothetical protein CRG98_026870 [Punica granatum]